MSGKDRRSRARSGSVRWGRPALVMFISHWVGWLIVGPWWMLVPGLCRQRLQAAEAAGRADATASQSRARCRRRRESLALLLYAVGQLLVFGFAVGVGVDLAGVGVVRRAAALVPLQIFGDHLDPRGFDQRRHIGISRGCGNGACFELRFDDSHAGGCGPAVVVGAVELLVPFHKRLRVVLVALRLEGRRGSGLQVILDGGPVIFSHHRSGCRRDVSAAAGCGAPRADGVERGRDGAFARNKGPGDTGEAWLIRL